MTPADRAGDFGGSLGCLTTTAIKGLVAQLASIAGLENSERALIAKGADASLTRVLQTKLSPLLLLELNAARVNGRLTGESSQARWDEFVSHVSTFEFWRSVSKHYPTLLPRVESIVRNRCDAIAEFAGRLAADRRRLDRFAGTPLGALRRLTLTAGDSHRGGRSVMLLHFAGRSLVYKPRSVAIDMELRRFTLAVTEARGVRSQISVPRVLDCGDYGWAEFIEHRHVGDAAELQSFYRGIGQWIALMRLLGGSDLHAENLIAHGPTPVVIDCETLFAPRLKPVRSGMGAAFDTASERISGSVMNIGLLPSRGSSLGWRGVDVSGIGALPGEQPLVPQTRIVRAGSDTAHVGTELVPAKPAQNHPSNTPSLAAHWLEIVSGFNDTTRVLQTLDAAGELAPMLQRFSDCPIRIVPRATEAYAELGRMLWHPVSLHKQEEAEQRAHDLLAKMADQKTLAPSDGAVIRAEIAELLEGDVPFFATTAGHGQLRGPRGTHWLSPCDLVSASLDHWRNADWALEREIIQSTLVSAYESEVWSAPVVGLRVDTPRLDDIESRRRQQAAEMMRCLLASSIRGDDGSVAWIASVLGPAGRTVQPLGQDLYGGISGIALAVAAYRREVLAGRADAISDLDAVQAGLVKTMELAETQSFMRRGRVDRPRPPTPGGYIGLGSQIWTWLTLDHWDAAAGAGLEHACRLAELVPEAVAGDEVDDVLSGKAGVIVPLIMLAEASGRAGFLDMAIDAGDRLCESAHRKSGVAYWAHGRWPHGMGGFAHGVTGIAWALSKLAHATGIARFDELSAEAMAFEAQLYDPDARNWRDLRMLRGASAPAAWCHGAVGIGLTLAERLPSKEDSRLRARLSSAADTAWRQGIGLNHGICHGDLGAWEFLDRAIQLGTGPAELERDQLLATVLTSLEQHGPVCGVAGKAYAPGLMGGLSGIAYQLLRAQPESRLPSVMMMGGGDDMYTPRV